ncbi:hypothetical protein [Butyrivibrio sp.]|uniref:hypothetical protein n=1 Tax=Butyrivibrio sp. TaxID=28121 RepID=UPI0025BEDEB4|nr:hypothetical protein [Butyrivibrio sp.]MBQ9305605.1 hypothetical protein [Butyrivibrio sp.]
MEKKDLGGMLKGKLKEASDTVKNTVKDAKIPDVKLPDIKIPDVKVPDQVKNVFKKNDVTKDTPADEAKEVNAEHEQEIKKAEAQEAAEKKDAELSKSEIQAVRVISPMNAVKIFYYMMAVDGTIDLKEEEKFDLIGKEIDPDFDENKPHVVKKCEEQLSKVIDSDDYYDAVQDGVEEALLSQQVFDKGYVPARMLVWDLLTLAYSDESYNDVERKLMKYIVRKVDIPKDVFLEMENSYLTVDDLEKELKWIKTTDRPYLTIETQVKEIERREQAIYESIKALILL